MTEPNNNPPPVETVSSAAAATPGDFDSLAGVDLKAGELPSRLAPGVSRWMTWSFIALVFAVPLIQAALEAKARRWPQAFKLFTRTPTRRNLEAFEKRLEENSFAKLYVQPRVQLAVKSSFSPSSKSSQDPVQGQAVQSKTVQSNTDGAKTPFIQWLDNTGGGLMLHPFIDYTHCSGVAENQLDYFGFRNPMNYYFARPEGKLVVITGNSEIMGLTHQRPVAQRLEEYLNRHSSEKWHVLNLAMNGYTVPYEINAYVHLAYHLRPEIVISHSAGTDFFYGQMVPLEYKKLGLHYIKDVEIWYPKVRGIAIQGAGKWELVEGGQELLADGYLRAAKKYRDIVEQNGGHFILGVQKCDPEAGQNKIPPMQRKLWQAVHQLTKEVQTKIVRQKLDYVDFLQVADLKFSDPVHTTEESAQIMAEIYGAHILRRFPEIAGNAEPGIHNVANSPP
jgi:hypothetical protein